jgi:hypothetical protein
MVDAGRDALGPPSLLRSYGAASPLHRNISESKWRACRAEAHRVGRACRAKAIA